MHTPAIAISGVPYQGESAKNFLLLEMEGTYRKFCYMPILYLLLMRTHNGFLKLSERPQANNFFRYQIIISIFGKTDAII